MATAAGDDDDIPLVDDTAEPSIADDVDVGVANCCVLLSLDVHDADDDDDVVLW